MPKNEVPQSSEVAVRDDRLHLTAADALVVNAQMKKLGRNAISDLQSFQEAIDKIGAEVGAILNIEDYTGDGFLPLSDKDKLINVPFVIVDGHFPKSSKGKKETYVLLRVITIANDRWFFSDGSTGIYEQCIEVVEKVGRLAGALVRGGLVKSGYDYVDEAGNTTEASTYYFNTAAGA